MDSESIDYKALYERISGELEKLKLDMWKAQQRWSVANIARTLYHALLSRFADMTALEIIAAAAILSLAVHYHLWIEDIKHE